MSEWFGKVWEHLHMFFLGLLAAVLVAPFQRQATTPKQITVFLLSGGCCSQLLTGLFCARYSVAPENAYGIGFLLGLFGGAFIVAIVRAIESIDFTAIITAVVQSWLSGGKK